MVVPLPDESASTDETADHRGRSSLNGKNEGDAMMRKCWLDGILYVIPDAWLMGAMQVRKALGMTPNEAAIDALKHWARQEQMAKEWTA